MAPETWAPHHESIVGWRGCEAHAGGGHRAQRLVGNKSELAGEGRRIQAGWGAVVARAAAISSLATQAYSYLDGLIMSEVDNFSCKFGIEPS